MLLLTLSNLSGDEFQRTSAFQVRCCQGTVCNAIGKTLDAILELKDRFVCFRSPEETQESADFIRDRFGLNNFPYAIDGCHMVFHGAPRGIPEHSELIDFYNRKGHYSLNCQVIADSKYRILDVDCRWPGSAHDA
jgi:hypothetical protein